MRKRYLEFIESGRRFFSSFIGGWVVYFILFFELEVRLVGVCFSLVCLVLVGSV